MNNTTDIKYFENILQILGLSEDEAQKTISNLTELFNTKTIQLLLEGLDEKSYKELEGATKDKSAEEKQKTIGAFLKEKCSGAVLEAAEKKAAGEVMSDFLKFAMDGASEEKQDKISKILTEHQ